MDLNPQQKLAVQADDKPLLIVAGAGTGKTRTLTGRLAYLIEKGVPPDKILALTFTNKAAKEMAERVFSSTNNESGTNVRIRKFVNNSLFADGHGPFIGTFHSLGARILRSEAKLLGRNGNFVIFDDSDSLQLVKKLLKANSAKDKGDDYAGAAEISNTISKIKNGVVSEKSVMESSAKGAMAVKIFHAYEKELAKNNAFDFDDLIGKVVEIFKKNPAILQKYRKRFHHLLIDEYQDLNNKQYELVKFLVGDSPRISVVGDDQQMIYSFRGSNFRIFLDFEKDWPDANVILLEENYRSTSNIIRAASEMISHNRYQKPKTLWTKKENGALVRITESGDDEEEAEWMAGQIESRIMNNELRKGGEKENYIIHDSRLRQGFDEQAKFIIPSIAVLYRTNAQSRAIEQSLIEKGLPYQIFGGLRFYERKEIKDIIAALRFAQNQKDEVSRERLEKNISKGRFSRFQESLCGNEPSVSPTELIHSFLDSTDYLDLVDRNFLNADERRENIAELLHFASDFSALPMFLEQIALLQPTDNAVKQNNLVSMVNGQRSNVQLMTIHLAKGLEFDSVFVAGCNEGTLPHNRSLKTEMEIEEERRLMYVAMTRARKELFLSFYDIPSRFLGEIPGELVEFGSLVSDGRDFSDLDNEERYITLD